MDSRLRTSRGRISAERLSMTQTERTTRQHKHNVYRDGVIHVCDRLCDTCIYRPDTHLADVRERMERESIENQTAIVCHSTIYGANGNMNAVCRGFYERHKTDPLQLAERLGCIKFVSVSCDKCGGTGRILQPPLPGVRKNPALKNCPRGCKPKDSA